MIKNKSFETEKDFKIGWMQNNVCTSSCNLNNNKYKKSRRQEEAFFCLTDIYRLLMQGDPPGKSRS
jgi:hypothetical protein